MVYVYNEMSMFCKTNVTEIPAGVAEQVLACFSLYQNVPVIVSARQSRDAIGCINGIRFIAMCCVLLGHSYSGLPYGNEICDFCYDRSKITSLIFTSFHMCMQAIALI